MKKWRKLLGIFMSGVMLLTGGVLPQNNAAAAEDAAGYGISSPRTEGGVTTWDKIKFGSYYQDFEEQPAEPIKWRVLSVDEDDAFLIADKILDTQPYNEKDKSVTWETCSLRTWLNDDFYNEAFDEEEQKAINETIVVNGDNPTYGTEGGEETHDKVYLPSIDEVSNAEYGFDTESTKKSNTRTANSTGYARVSGVDIGDSYRTANSNGGWWLRSPGYCSYRALSVSYDGCGEFDGDIVNHSGYGIRPVLHINISSSKVTYAGKVSSNGSVTEPGNEDYTPGNPYVGGSVTTWDCVYFGTYKQEFSKKQDIEWRVLSVEGDDAFLLADKNLDCKRFDWKGYISDFNSELSWWLRYDFYNEAFDEEEKEAVVSKDITLLSVEDACNAEYGFDTEFSKKSKTREVQNTDYAKAKGAWFGDDDSTTDNGCWWLRPSDTSDYERPAYSSSYIDITGFGYGYESNIPYEYLNGVGVRPALHINLSSSSWEPAGQVTAVRDGGETPVTSPEPTDYGISAPITKKGVTTWDKIKFGSYYQEAGAEPIKWRVLSVDGDDVFLLADQILDAVPYNEEINDVTWETCTLRKWLNEDFYDEAFDEEEKEAINETTVADEDNLADDTGNGKDTGDKVFLLSAVELSIEAYGFFAATYEETYKSQAKNTDYAKVVKDAWTNCDDYRQFGNGKWWLRTFDNDFGKSASIIDDSGIRNGAFVDDRKIGVRPALHIKRSSSKMKYAGTVDSQGSVTMPDDDTASEISNPEVGEDGETTWDCVYFGNYKQTFSAKQDIEWRVLSVDGDDAFLLADRNLSYRNYNSGDYDKKWETCTLRRWLNEDFYNDAFDDKEKEAIKDTTVDNSRNDTYNTCDEANTKDKVYLLSVAEADNAAYGFGSDKTRITKDTDYVKYEKFDKYERNTVISWLLRSITISSYYYGQERFESYVDYDGRVSSGYSSYYNAGGVRPVLHINLSSGSWSKAGKINSNGEVIEETSTPLPGTTAEPSQTDKPGASAEPTGTPTDYGVSDPVSQKGIMTWDKIKFGSYYQDAEAQPVEPIKWRVLSVDGDDAFLLADRILDAKPYNDGWGTTWVECTLRQWLNEDFYHEAFDEEEQKAIKETWVSNEYNPEYGTEGGGDTFDKVYLLSIAEASNKNYGLEADYAISSKTREAKSTDYAMMNGAVTSEYNSTAGNGYWWLRSPGNESYNASYVNDSGYGNYVGAYKTYVSGVRPVLHVNISSSKLKAAGKVDSEGNVTVSDGKISIPTVEDGVTTWDCVYFGNYRQDFSVKQDIEWRVLSVDGDEALILAEKNLEYKQYNKGYDGTDDRVALEWKTCTLRSWLNNEFYKEAFDENERKAINLTTVVDGDEKNGTYDNVYVYLLSTEDASNMEYGFDKKIANRSKTREAASTDYAKINYTSSSTSVNGPWWLRSSGTDSSMIVSYIDNYGIGHIGSYNEDSSDYIRYSDVYGVRPALRIKLSSDSWRKAGQIKSNGEVIEETPAPTPSPTPSPEPTDEPSTSAEPTGEPTQTDEPVASAEPTEAPNVYGIKSPKVENGVTTWDKIKFGSYYQDGEAQPAEPIKWRVLSVNGDDAFLIADQILDYKLYDDEYRRVKWEECTLRKWLNEDFYNEAFDDDEKKDVSETTVVTDEDHPYYAEEGGNTTKDKVYLLSIPEASNKAYGFDTEFLETSKAREAKNTDHARINGADTDINGNGNWLLRSHSRNFDYGEFYSGRITLVSSGGSGWYNITDYPISIGGVRPAMHIKLSSSKVKDAGEVDSEGNVTALDNGIHNPTVKDGVTTWDCVYFGNYRQNHTFEKQDIEWRVLSVDGDDAFLLADRILDCKQYNEENAEATWETSTLRKWLNEDFFDEAFDTNEKQAIIEKTITNKGSNNTKDKVYLLSEAEATTAMYGFDAGSGYAGFYASETRQAKNTLYAKVNSQQSDIYGTTGNDTWWLRTLNADNEAIFVNHSGSEDSRNMYYGKCGVRPALHINLSSSSWSKTGEVSSDEKEDDKPTASPSPVPTPTKEPSPTDKPTTTAEPTKEPLPTPVPTPPRTPRPSPSPSPSPTGEPSSTDKPTTTAEPTKGPSPTDKPTTTAEPTKGPTPTDKPTTTAEPTKGPSPTDKPTTTAEPTKGPSPTDKPTTTAEPTKGPSPTDKPTTTAEPTKEPSLTDKPVQTFPPTGGVQLTPPSAGTPNPVQTVKPALKKFKLSSVKRTKNTMKITGKVSVKKATVKIKVGKKAYKKAKVKGKKFTLKLKYKLKKKTKIKIQVKKKGYKKLVKTYKVK